MNARIAACVCLLSLFAACSDSQRSPMPSGLPSGMDGEVPPAANAQAAKAPLVVFLGDSLTAGSGLPLGEAYPALIQARLDRDGRAVRILNAGVSGDTSAGGLARLDWMLEQHPDIVVVALGANDGLRGLPVAELDKNLTAILDKCRAAGAKCLLVGMLVPPNYGEDYARAFAEVYPRVAAANDVPLVPFLLEGVGGNPAFNQADGIHPNTAGQEKLADTVWRGLADLLPAK